MMIYKNGKEEKPTDCCGKCFNFITDGTTVGEIAERTSSFVTDQYKDALIGECKFDYSGYDPHNIFNGPNHYRWSTHTPCEKYDEI